MFGYVRPLKSELKVREFEQFKAGYCSLCHALREKYGFFARFILNYDFTFLSMLLWAGDESIKYTKRCCPISPCKKRFTCESSRKTNQCAGYSVILAWCKLQDSIEDETFFASLKARIFMLFLHRAYKNASTAYPDFADFVHQQLVALSAAEKNGEQSIDKMADKFAVILQFASAGFSTNTEKAAAGQLLYHMGRWIYILDAVNDIKEDYIAKRYNPIAAHYHIQNGVLAVGKQEEIKVTLRHSQNLVCSAYELMDRNPWSDIIRNIIYLGMPNVCEKVFDGTFKNTREAMPR